MTEPLSGTESGFSALKARSISVNWSSVSGSAMPFSFSQASFTNSFGP